MEEDILFHQSDNGTEDSQAKKRRQLSLLVSILFHIVLLILSASFFNPISELFKDEEVRTVFLVEGKRLVFPEREFLEQGSVQNRENLESGENSPIERPAPLSQNRPTASREEIEQYLASLFSKSIKSEIQLDPEILNSFTLDQPDEGEFSLVYDPESLKNLEKYPQAGIQSKKLTGLLYPYGMATNRGISGRLRSYNPEGSSPQPLSQSAGPLQIKDLKPWANKVLEKIERNWVIDPVSSQGIKGIVGISVTIAKSGEIIFVEVTKSSGNQTLDSFAKNAVERSAPLPNLPIMYPSKSIIFTIEFEY